MDSIPENVDIEGTGVITDQNAERLALLQSLSEDAPCPDEVKSWVSLDFSHLSSTVPSSIRHCTGLKTLKLTGNDFEDTFPREVLTIKSLEELDLEATSINKIPTQIKDLTNLKKLNIARNKFHSLPREFCELRSLEDLNISGNPLIGVSHKVEQEGSEGDDDDESQNDDSLPEVERSEESSEEESYFDIDSVESDEWSWTSDLDFPSVYKESVAALEQQLSGRYRYKRIVFPSEMVQLKNLKRLDASSTCLEKFPDLICELHSLENLSIRDNKIKEIPKKVQQLVNLKNVDVSQNHLAKFPIAVCKLTNLEDLSVSKTGIQTVPSQIGQLRRLKRLDLSRNLLTACPREVCEIPQLENLNLRKNKITSVTQEMRSCLGLKQIDLSFNLLNELPHHMYDLPSLEILNLSNNQISDVPEVAVPLPNDQESCESRRLDQTIINLDVGTTALDTVAEKYAQADATLNDNSNRLPNSTQTETDASPLDSTQVKQAHTVSHVPGEISTANQSDENKYTDSGNTDIETIYSRFSAIKGSHIAESHTQENYLSNLHTLDLSGNKLDEFPTNLPMLSSLQNLNLNNNKLNNIPSELRHLEKLKKLNLAGNELYSFPGNVCQLKRLEVLNLSNNNIKTVPDDLEQMSNLQSLDLSWCQLQAFPNPVLRLPNLKALLLIKNDIADVPQDIHLLKSLEKLDLSWNRLSEFPSPVSQVTSLTELSISNNDFQTVPDDIVQLRLLKKLNLSRNKIASFPVPICSLSKLQDLSISNSNIASIPLEIKLLKGLKRLNLSRNKFTEFPEALASMNTIEDLDLGDNAIKEVPLHLPAKLKRLNLSGNRLYAFPASVCDTQGIETLNLSRNIFKHVPFDIKKLKHLKSLDLSNNKLKEFPLPVCWVTSLEELNLRNTYLVRVRDEIGKLRHLKRLILSKNPSLDPLPEAVCKVSSLVELEMKQCDMKDIPSFIRQLVKLEKLYLSGNKMKVFPDSISFIKTLEELSLSNNDICNLDTKISTLNNLRKLYLSNNRFDGKKEVVVGTETQKINILSPLSDLSCRSLEELSLRKCSLAAIPPGLRDMSSLKKFDVSDNKLQTEIIIPSRLTKLTNLDLSKNGITSLPTDLHLPISLAHLNLSENSFSEIPESLFSLKRLQMLNLSHNSIRTVPKQIESLANLKDLNLYKNNLDELPSSVYKLLKMERLVVGGNRIREISTHVRDLQNLRELDLQKNSLSEFPFSLCSLSWLQNLDLCENGIKAVPAEIKQMRHLHNFDISKNKVEKVPSELGSLGHLRRLKLDRNNISKLPTEMRFVMDAAKVNLTGNPLVQPPPEVVQRGNDAVARYLEDLSRSKSESSSRLQVHVLGETETGKTSLVKSLVAREPILTEKANRTHVVEQQTWEPTENVFLNINDFGGHDVYKVAYNFFLTVQTLVLLVFDLRLNLPEEYKVQIGDWIDNVYSRTPETSMVLVGTHSDLLGSEEVESKTKDVKQALVDHLARKKDKLQVAVDNIERKIEESSDETLKKAYEEKLKKFRSLLDNPPKVDTSKIYCISSGNGDGIKQIEELLTQAAKKQMRIIPESWLLKMKEIEEAKFRNTAPYLKLSSLQSKHKDKVGDPEVEKNAESINASAKKSPVHNPDWEKDAESTYATINESGVSTHGAKGNNEFSNATSEVSSSNVSENEKEPENRKAEHSEITDPEDILQYLRLTGGIIWYAENEELRDFVFHKQDVLVNILKAILRNDMEHVLDYARLPFRNRYTAAKFDSERKDVLTKGVISRTMLECLWEEFRLEGACVKAMTDMLIKFEICYMVKGDEEKDSTTKFARKSDDKLHFPWLLKEKRPYDLSRKWPKTAPKDAIQITLEFHFPDPCPTGLYEKCAVLLHCDRIKQSGVEQSRIDWKDGACAQFSNAQLLLERSILPNSRGNGVIRVSLRHTDVFQLQRFANSLYNNLRHLMETESPGCPLDDYIVCPHCVTERTDKPTRSPPAELLHISPEKPMPYRFCDSSPVMYMYSADFYFPHAEGDIKREHIDALERHEFDLGKDIHKKHKSLNRITERLKAVHVFDQDDLKSLADERNEVERALLLIRILKGKSENDFYIFCGALHDNGLGKFAKYLRISDELMRLSSENLAELVREMISRQVGQVSQRKLGNALKIVDEDQAEAITAILDSIYRTAWSDRKKDSEMNVLRELLWVKQMIEREKQMRERDIETIFENPQ